MLMMTFPVFGAVGAAVAALIAAVGLSFHKTLAARTTDQELDELTYRLRHPVRFSLTHPVVAVRRWMERA